MDCRKFGDTYVVRMDRGEEVLSSLTALCKKKGIRLASVDALGALDQAVLGLYDVSAKTFHRREFNEPMELSSLTGTVTRKDGEVYLHLHATVCTQDLTAYGGHAVSLHISATCEMIVRCLPGEVDRAPDEATGLNLFSFR